MIRCNTAILVFHIFSSVAPYSLSRFSFAKFSLGVSETSKTLGGEGDMPRDNHAVNPPEIGLLPTQLTKKGDTKQQ